MSFKQTKWQAKISIISPAIFSQVAVKDCPAPTMDQEIYIDASGEMIMVGTSKFNSSVNKCWDLTWTPHSVSGMDNIKEGNFPGSHPVVSTFTWLKQGSHSCFDLDTTLSGMDQYQSRELPRFPSCSFHRYLTETRFPFMFWLRHYPQCQTWVKRTVWNIASPYVIVYIFTSLYQCS